MKGKRKDKRLSVRVDEDMLMVLDAFKEARGYTHSKTIRNAVVYYLEYVTQQDKNVTQLEK